MTTPDGSIVRALHALNRGCTGVAGVGVDLVDVGTVERLLSSNPAPFLDTAWTRVEQRDAAGDPERLAARWAAKEAVMKALGRGLGDVDPRTVEIMNDQNGKPVARLRGSAARVAKQAGVETVHVSMSHDEGWAVAFAVGSRPAEQPAQSGQNGRDRRESHGG